METIATVDTIMRFEPSTDTSNSVLHLHGGQALFLRKSAPLYDTWVGIISRKMKTNGKIYIRYEENSHLVSIIRTPTLQTVVRLDTKPQDHVLEVSFVPAAAIYFVKMSDRNYHVMHNFLEGSLRNKTPLLMTNDPVTMEIVDVRIP